MARMLRTRERFGKFKNAASFLHIKDPLRPGAMGHPIFADAKTGTFVCMDWSSGEVLATEQTQHRCGEKARIAIAARISKHHGAPIGEKVLVKDPAWREGDSGGPWVVGKVIHVSCDAHRYGMNVTYLVAVSGRSDSPLQSGSILRGGTRECMTVNYLEKTWRNTSIADANASKALRAFCEKRAPK